MTEYSIILPAEMVKALLEGLKTQIRTPMTPRNTTVLGYRVNEKDNLWRGLVWDERVRVDSGPHMLHPWASQYLHVPWVNPDDVIDDRVFRVRSLHEVGDILWVREVFITDRAVGGYAEGVDPDKDPFGKTIDVIYRADDGPNERTAGGWQSPATMARRYSRIARPITGIKAQRLHDNDLADRHAELGISLLSLMSPVQVINEFVAQWDKTYAKKGFGYDTNPFTWVRTIGPRAAE